MEPAPPPWRAKVIGRWILFFTICIALPLGYFLWKMSSHAVEHRRMLDRTLAGATTVRVWGAGMRQGNGFCPCGIVPKPERVFFESSDPAVVGDLIRSLQPRQYLELEPSVSTCGTVTIDFLRGEDLLLSVHPFGGDLRTTRGTIPITEASRERIEEWLAARTIRQRIEAALLAR